MKRLRKTPVALPASVRAGTTLTEVLISILCMGIGVVAVASLFPIALLRSVQATQITSATILRYNAETFIDLNLNLVFDPDNDAATNTSNFREHYGTEYLIDPLGRINFNSGNVGKIPRFDLGLNNAGVAANLVTLPDSWVDWYDVVFESPATPVDDMTAWEYVDVPTNLLASGPKGPLDEIFQTLPADDTSANPSDPQAIFRRDSTAVLTESDAPVRVLLFDSTGRLSESRELVNQNYIDTANNRIKWPRTKRLPSNGQYGSLSRIRLQFGERRYTWMLTVRNDTPTSFTNNQRPKAARVYAVIFFRRSFAPEDEIPYKLTRVGTEYLVNKLTQNEWNSAYMTAYPSPYPDPFLKKGGFLLDTDEGTWHRVQTINESTQRIKLEKNIKTLSNDHVVFMRGVVEVYYLGQKQL